MVQPEVKAFGNQATTTAFLPLKSESWYVLPSLACELEVGSHVPHLQLGGGRGRRAEQGHEREDRGKAHENLLGPILFRPDVIPLDFRFLFDMIPD